MADGAELFRPKTGVRIPRRPEPDPDFLRDKQKLNRVRTASVSLQELINTANTIHNADLRDAALGRLIKKRIREVATTPALARIAESEKANLTVIVDMMHDPEKREAMAKRVQSTGKKK